ncbi:hypothetical protein M8J76_017364 [Diaphorina citri]|nr:hypothetical protein M8J75_001440 [Diaphorina citri]KAI5746108.1 hypothetical protein M8J76_017364 [Diaphorina citri]KAI5753079.1 hypothetical protein M8J77_023250 [Diaphorina citri]
MENENLDVELSKALVLYYKLRSKIIENNDKLIEMVHPSKQRQNETQDSQEDEHYVLDGVEVGAMVQELEHNVDDLVLLRSKLSEIRNELCQLKS